MVAAGSTAASPEPPPPDSTTVSAPPTNGSSAATPRAAGGLGLAAQAKATAAAQAKTGKDAQRAALLSFMQAHNLQVTDVLRLCADLVDDASRI